MPKLPQTYIFVRLLAGTLIGPYLAPPGGVLAGDGGERRGEVVHAGRDDNGDVYGKTET